MLFLSHQSRHRNRLKDNCCASETEQPRWGIIYQRHSESGRAKNRENKLQHTWVAWSWLEVHTDTEQAAGKTRNAPNPTKYSLALTHGRLKQLIIYIYWLMNLLIGLFVCLIVYVLVTIDLYIYIYIYMYIYKYVYIYIYICVYVKK